MRNDVASSGFRPAVSVVVPVYNAAKYLPATLDALLGQTLFRRGEMEILFSDDSSTDDSAAICRRCAEAHPGRVRFLSGPHQGIAAVRNRALDAARGQWIGFCDADDLPEPDHWEKLLEDALETGAEIAMCAFRSVGPMGNGLVFRPFPFDGDRIVLSGRREIARRYFRPFLDKRAGYLGPVWAAIFDRDLVLRHGIRFVPRFFKGQDDLFMAECLAQAKRVSASGRVGYGYVQHGDSITTRFWQRYDAHARAALECRQARERLRVIRRWDRWRLHPLARLVAGLRWRVRLVRFFDSSPLPAMRARVPRLVRALVRRLFPDPYARPASPEKDPSAPAVSVVVPVYNAAEYLPATIDALLGQTLFRRGEMEILFSDDSSTDDSSAICRRCAEAHPGRVRLLSGSIRDISVARNRAIDAARGRWIGFCDADDLPEPDHWEKLVEDALETGVEIAMCAFRSVGSMGNGLVFRPFPFDGDRIVLSGRREIARRYFRPFLDKRAGYLGPVWAAIFDRDFIMRHGIRFIPRVSKGQDHLFMAECLALAKRVSASGRVGYGYVQHADSITTGFWRRYDTHARAALGVRQARERIRIFRRWDRRRLHPLGRFAAELRWRVRLVRFFDSSPLPAMRARVPRPVRALVRRFFRDPHARPVGPSRK